MSLEEDILALAREEFGVKICEDCCKEIDDSLGEDGCRCDYYESLADYPLEDD
jgi:hypothetical protein